MTFSIVSMYDRFSKPNTITRRFSKLNTITWRFTNSLTNLTLFAFWVTLDDKGLFSYILVTHCVSAWFASKRKESSSYSSYSLVFFFLNHQPSSYTYPGHSWVCPSCPLCWTAVRNSNQGFLEELLQSFQSYYQGRTQQKAC